MWWELSCQALKDNDGDDNKSYTDGYGDDDDSFADGYGDDDDDNDEGNGDEDDGYGDEDDSDRKKATMKTAPTLCQWDAGSPRG